MKLDKHDVVIQAVEKLKGSEFQATAIKVELEAQTGRRSSNCGDCDNGWIGCPECDGSWEGDRCQNNCDEGNWTCDTCEGSGEIETDGQTHGCDDCDGNGAISCEECYSDGYYDNCEYCEEGQQRCSYCDGESTQEDRPNFGSVLVCHEWFMEKLSALGLAERREDTRLHGHSNSDTHWFPVAPLAYAEFYNDGSVDSELTFTLSLENPESVFLLPKIIDIFNEFGRTVGDTVSVAGAGMHMALLNTPNYSYPSDTHDRVRYDNFKLSMNLLMPALFFLASSNENSRGLGYRRPEIGFATHRSAIDYRNGALEFRVFDTCYSTPEAILDNLVVISKCMKYWTLEYTKNNLRKLVPKGCRFGVDGSDKLDRFYVTIEQLELLNAGLPKLKPDYYSVTELKQQRKFKINKGFVKNRTERVRKEAYVKYTEYEDRFSWTVEIRRHRLRADFLERLSVGKEPEERMQLDKQKVAEEAQVQAEKAIEEYIASKVKIDKFVEDEMATDERRNVGEFQLA